MSDTTKTGDSRPIGFAPLGLAARIRKPDLNLETAALFDTLLICLMFLTLGSRFIFSPGTTIDLPGTDITPQDMSPTLDVATVVADNFLLYDGKPLRLEQFKLLMEQLAEQDTLPEDAVLLLKIDRDVSTDTFMRVANLARAGGYARIQVPSEYMADDEPR